jgi:hypothetical protein
MQEFPPLCGLRFVRSLLLLGNLKLDLLPFFFYKLLVKEQSVLKRLED